MMLCAHLTQRLDGGRYICVRCERDVTEVFARYTRKSLDQPVTRDDLANTVAATPPPPPRYTLPSQQQCEALTVEGERCRRDGDRYMGDGTLCAQHWRAIYRPEPEREPSAPREPCAAKTAKGTPCTRLARRGTHRCAQHTYFGYSGDLSYVDTRSVRMEDDE